MTVPATGGPAEGRPAEGGPLPRCSTAARARADPLSGTAAPAARWLLVEYPGPWATLALDSGRLVRGAGQRLARAAHDADARVLLVRRPGRRPAGQSRRTHGWVVVTAERHQHWGRWEHPDDLTAAADALAADPPPAGPQDPLLLVCTHALHDVCCAVRGRPVAKALASTWPSAVWECSHLGGDRFAANLLVLPDGAYYGFLDPVTALPTVEAHLRGRVETAHLRGVASEPPPVQAAIVEALRRFGPAAITDIGGTHLRPVGPDRWEVRLAGSPPLPPLVEATVSGSRRPPAVLTCRAAGASTAYTYAVDSLRSVTGTHR
jgi:(2Fe-2S) ferredoxin